MCEERESGKCLEGIDLIVFNDRYISLVEI